MSMFKKINMIFIFYIINIASSKGFLTKPYNYYYGDEAPIKPNMGINKYINLGISNLGISNLGISNLDNGLTNYSKYPTILLHGIASSKKELLVLEYHLEMYGVPVYNLEIGNGVVDSIFMSMNEQCDIFSKTISNLNIESEYINIIAISQGGLTARCYVEKYSHLIKPVHSLITWASPHSGYYNTDNSFTILDYWKDPFNYFSYTLDNKYLKYINNDITHPNNSLYKNNLKSLKQFMIVWSNIDKAIKPLESSKFEFYNIEKAVVDKQLVITPLKDTDFYKYDYIGLKYLNDTHRLSILRFDCDHDKFKSDVCFNTIKNDETGEILLPLTIKVLG
jgi:palmitoyl-protein thioesterase